MKIYLDNCCYNRPFDDQSDIIIRLETEPKLFIQQKVKEKANKLMASLGLKQMDAAHIACAIEKRADYFITTDRKILNKQIEGISIASPTTFVQEFFI